MDYYQMAAHSNGMAGTNNLGQRQADVNRFMTSKASRARDRRLLNKAFSEILFRLRFNHVFALDRSLKLPDGLPVQGRQTGRQHRADDSSFVLQGRQDREGR